MGWNRTTIAAMSREPETPAEAQGAGAIRAL